MAHYNGKTLRPDSNLIVKYVNTVPDVIEEEVPEFKDSNHKSLVKSLVTEPAKEIKSTFGEITGNSRTLFNLMYMVILWSVSTSCYYLIQYQLKYIKGDLYVNGIVSSLAEVVACISSAFIKKAVGLKKAFILAFCLASGCMACIMVSESDNQVVLASFVLGAKFGISMAFNLVYLANS